MDPYKFDQLISKQESLANPDDLPGFLFSRKPRTETVLIAGVDEAGRGPLAGPVVAAAVLLPRFPKIKGLNDSKALSQKNRDDLYPQIRQTALAFSIVSVDSLEIDQTNILAASLLAMRRSIEDLAIRPSLVLVDGNQKPRSSVNEITLVGGDAKSASIMAASILAKVYRDRIMEEAHKVYPQYGFRDHKGYGSKDHLEAIQKYGPCPLHRKSFSPLKEKLSNPVLIPSED